MIIFMVCICCLNLTSCYQQREYKYYSDESNFITVTAEIFFLNYDEDNAVLYLGFLNLPEVFSDNCFKITGDNWKVIEQRGGKDCFAIGDEITFITAPRYFGNGYVMPIVAVSIKGEVLLEYEQGYENFMSEYK